MRGRESVDLWSRESLLGRKREPARSYAARRWIPSAEATRRRTARRAPSRAAPRSEVRGVTGQDGGGFRTGPGRTLRGKPHRCIGDPVPDASVCIYVHRRRPRAVTRYRFRGRVPPPFRAREPPRFSQGHHRQSRERARARARDCFSSRFRINRSLIGRISHWDTLHVISIAYIVSRKAFNNSSELWKSTCIPLFDDLWLFFLFLSLLP